MGFWRSLWTAFRDARETAREMEAIMMYQASADCLATMRRADARTQAPRSIVTHYRKGGQRLRLIKPERVH